MMILKAFSGARADSQDKIKNLETGNESLLSLGLSAASNQEAKDGNSYTRLFGWLEEHVGREFIFICENFLGFLPRFHSPGLPPWVPTKPTAASE
jgi:hypothetical protein